MVIAISGGMWVRAVGSLVGEKKIIMEAVPKGMKMDLAAMRVNASEFFCRVL